MQVQQSAGAAQEATKGGASSSTQGQAAHSPGAGPALKRLLAGLDFAQAAALLAPPKEERAAAPAKDTDEDAIENAVPEGEAKQARALTVPAQVIDPELLATVRALTEQVSADEGAGPAPEVTPPPAPQAQAEAGAEELEVAAQQAGAPEPLAEAAEQAATPRAAEARAPVQRRAAAQATGPLSSAQARQAIRYNQQRHGDARVVKRIQEAVHVARTGSVDVATVQAVARFQRGLGLAVDGMVGQVTMGHVITHLKREHGLVSQLTNSERGAAIMWNRGQRLDRELVKKLQRKLGVTPDGAIGPATTNAIARFQATHQLGVNGHLNPNTISAIRRAQESRPPQRPPRGSGGGGHFSINEFRSKDGSPTPQWAIPNLLALIEQLEVLRAALGGAAIHVTSGYRSPRHNAAVGGERNSYHMKGMAADISVAGHSVSKVHAKIERLIAQGRMKQGGLGLYSSFVHYDIRGYKARW